MMSILKKILASVSAVSLCGVGYIAYDIQRCKVYSHQSFLEAAKHYFTVRSLYVMGRIMARKLEAATKDVRTAQKEFLLQQIKENRNTQFFKDMQLDKVKSVEDFLQLFPLTDYTYYSRYISRMMSGEKNVMTSQPPIIFAVTSGTSGNSKIIPMLMKQTKLFFLEVLATYGMCARLGTQSDFQCHSEEHLKKKGISVLYKCMVDAYPQTKMLSRDLKIFFSPNWRYTVDEIPIGPNSASPDRSEKLLHIYTTPLPAYDVKSEPEALYLYLLFALLDPHVGLLEANFASIIYNAFCALEAQLPQLADDIERGVINQDLKIDPATREQLQALIKPNPARAGELRLAALGGKVGMARKIWPDLQVVLGADTGTFDLYAEKLRNGYCKDVPLYSPIYAASEGLLGINIWPGQFPSRYLLHPRAQFFEFIPESLMDEENPKTHLMHEVKEGETYELVITNPSCLYRYRFGDVVKVVRFHNQCPVIEFKYRKGQFLNVRGEKLSEKMFYDVLKETVSNMCPTCNLGDYCCVESVILDGFTDHQYKQPCYHVFVELETLDGSGDKKTITKSQSTLLDEALQKYSYPYSSFRQKGSIGPVQVHLVHKGSFQSLRRFMLEKPTAASNQYKIPRVLRNQEAVKFILDRVER